MYQRLFQVEFITKSNSILPRFLPIMNASQLKTWHSNREEIIKIANEKAEIANYEPAITKDDGYRTLEEMNERDYELSGFFVVFDDKNLPHQIAIFTRYELINHN